MDIKEVMKKRYRMIKNDTWDEGSMNPYRSIKGKREGQMCREFRMIYEDTITKKKFTLRQWDAGRIYRDSWAFLFFIDDL